MTLLRAFLLASTLLIFPISIYVIVTMGINWTTVYVDDLRKLDWHAQFDTDFLIYLCLLAIWVTWREGLNPKGFLFGFLSFSCGSLFACPYLLVATYNAKGDPKAVLLGVHANKV